MLFSWLCSRAFGFIPVKGLTLYTQHQSVYSPYCSPHISKEADKENLFHNQELL